MLAAATALVACLAWAIVRHATSTTGSPRPAIAAQPAPNLPPGRAAAIEDSFAELARKDPAKALKAADALDSSQREAALLGALRVLVAESPDLAFAAIEAYGDDPRTRSALLQGLLARWTQQAGDETVHRYFLQRPPTAGFDTVYAELAATVAEGHPSEANTWLIKISDPALCETTTLAVAAQLETTHPEIAAKLIVDLMFTMPDRAPESLTLNRLGATMPKWAARDRAAAFSFVYSLGGVSSAGRNGLLRQLALTSDH